MSVFLAIMMISVISCRKTNNCDPDVPSGPPVPPAAPAAFADRPLQMMSAQEISGLLEFPGHLLNRLGNSLARGGEEPGILDPLKEIGESLWEVYDYFHTEAEFDQVNNSLSQIQQQITILQGQVSQLSTQIGISTSELATLDITKTLNTCIADVKSAMDSTTINGLQYFPRRAAQFKAGQITLAQFSRILPTCGCLHTMYLTTTAT